MKKNTLLLIGLIIGIITIFALSIFVGNSSNPKYALSNDPETIIVNAQKESSAVKENEKKDFTYINLDQYFEMLDGEEQKIILLAKPDCPYCQVAVPILQNIMYENDITIHYLNVSDFDEDMILRFIQSDKMWDDGYGTPMLYLIQSHAIIDVVDGLTDKAHYLEFFRTNHYIS